MENFLSKNWVAAVLLAVVILAVFGRSIWFDYVQLDEGVLLINNRFFITDISNIFEVFKHDVNYPSATSVYYRPIFTLSLMLNSQFGLSLTTYHIGNLLLHLAAVFMLFLFFRELGHSRSLSLAFSALFAIHPAVTSAVTWVPGRTEATLTIFIILSFILFMRFLRTGGWRYMLGLFASFIAALLTKEVAVALIPVMSFYYLINRKEKGGELLTTLSSGLVVILIAWYFTRENIIASARAAGDLTFLQMLSSFWSNSVSFVLYLGKAVLPFNLSVFPVLESSTLLYGFVALAILALFWIVFQVKVLSLSVLGLVWFVAFLAPSLVGFYPTEKMVFFEHRMYLPLIGVLLFFVPIWSARSAVTKSRILDAFGIGTIALFVALSFNYSGVYKDKFAFWQKAVADSPQASQAHKGLANAYLSEGRIEEALAGFEKTLELNPGEKRIHLLLGLYYLDQGQIEKGKEELEKEIETDPNQFVAYQSLGRIYAESKNFAEAEKNFLKALAINPDYILIHQDLAVFYFSQNDHPKAITHLKELLKRQTAESLHPQIKKILEIYTEEAATELGL